MRSVQGDDLAPPIAEDPRIAAPLAVDRRAAPMACAGAGMAATIHAGGARRGDEGWMPMGRPARAVDRGLEADRP